VLPATCQQQGEAKHVQQKQQLALTLLRLFSDALSTTDDCSFGSMKHELVHGELGKINSQLHATAA
jgi:hypothetical protein